MHYTTPVMVSWVCWCGLRAILHWLALFPESPHQLGNRLPLSIENGHQRSGDKSMFHLLLVRRSVRTTPRSHSRAWHVRVGRCSCCSSQSLNGVEESDKNIWKSVELLAAAQDCICGNQRWHWRRHLQRCKLSWRYMASERGGLQLYSYRFESTRLQSSCWDCIRYQVGWNLLLERTPKTTLLGSCYSPKPSGKPKRF